jgi:hypothetical protein
MRAQQQYGRAAAIAKRDNLQVVAHGTRKSDGAAVYAVPSRSKANTWHLIVVEGLHLICDCPRAVKFQAVLRASGSGESAAGVGVAGTARQP